MHDVKINELLENKVLLFNKLFDYRKEKDMLDDCILDVIISFGNDINIDPELIASELSDYQAFRNIVEQDLKKFNYIKSNKKYFCIEDWN